MFDINIIGGFTRSQSPDWECRQTQRLGFGSTFFISEVGL